MAKQKVDPQLAAYRREIKRKLLIVLKGERYVSEFIREMRELGIDLGSKKVIENIAKDPSELSVMISFYGLGLTTKVIEAKKKMNKD